MWHQAVGRVGQDRRRPPVVAAPQARRVGRRAALPAHRARGRRTPRRRPRPDRAAQPDPHRRRRGRDGAARDAGADGDPAPRLRARGPPRQRRPGGAGDRDGGVGAGDDDGAVSVYLARINAASDDPHHGPLPRHRPIGPDPGEDDRVRAGAQTGQARVDDVDGGAADPGAGLAGRQLRGRRRHPGDPGRRARARLGRPAPARPGCAGRPRPGAAGRRPGARRPARRRSCSRSARSPTTPGPSATTARPPRRVAGRRRSASSARALQPPRRADRAAPGARARGVSDLSHRLVRRSPRCGCASTAVADGDERDRPRRRPRRAPGDGRPRGARGPALRARGLVAAATRVSVLADRAALLGAAGRGPGPRLDARVPPGRRWLVHASEPTWWPWSTCCWTTSSPTRPRASPVAVTADPPRRRRPGARRSTTPGPGFPDGVDVVRRGASGADSTGLGLAIVDQTAAESGGGLAVGASPSGGGRVIVELGPPAVTGPAQRRVMLAPQLVVPPTCVARKANVSLPAVLPGRRRRRCRPRRRRCG